MANLKAGTLLIVSARASENGTPVALFQAIVEAEMNGGILISIPKSGGTDYPVGGDMFATIEYTDNATLSVFEAKIIKRVDKNRRFYLLMVRKGKDQEKNRRRDFRFDMLLDGFIRYNDPRDAHIEKIDVLTNNVSAGGASIWSPKGFDVGKVIMVTLFFDNGKTIELPCRIRRCSHDEKAAWTMRYSLGIEFVFSSPVQKQEISAILKEFERKKR